MQLRVGIGYDRHRLTETSDKTGMVRIGGVDITHDRVMVGHSDADVLLHAVTDALLGAAALGDIGQLFPDTDESNRDRDSAEMLSIAFNKVQDAGWQVVNIDCIVVAERPKLGPHRDAIRQRIAELLSIDPDAVGVKAKTAERLGPVGTEDAIDAHCVALLMRD